MRVRLLDDAKYGGRRVSAGTEIDVDDGTGVAWCRAGIAEDLDGFVPTGKRLNGVKLSVHSGRIGAASNTRT